MLRGCSKALRHRIKCRSPWGPSLGMSPMALPGAAASSHCVIMEDRLAQGLAVGTCGGAQVSLLSSRLPGAKGRASSPRSLQRSLIYPPPFLHRKKLRRRAGSTLARACPATRDRTGSRTCMTSP